MLSYDFLFNFFFFLSILLLKVCIRNSSYHGKHMIVQTHRCATLEEVVC